MYHHTAGCLQTYERSVHFIMNLDWDCERSSNGSSNNVPRGTVCVKDEEINLALASSSPVTCHDSPSLAGVR